MHTPKKRKGLGQSKVTLKKKVHFLATPPFSYSFIVLLFLQAHRETEAHFTAAGMSSQTNNSEALRFKRAAFYNGLKSKVGLAAAETVALRINLNVQGCGIVATPMHAPSHSPSAPPPSFTQSPYSPRSLVRDGQTIPHKPRLVVSHSTCPPLSSSPHAHSFVLGSAVINNNPYGARSA